MVTPEQIQAANEQEINNLTSEIKHLKDELKEAERLHGVYREALAEQNKRVEQAREMLTPNGNQTNPG